MILRLAAASAHLLTATGAAFALLALYAAAGGEWPTMFVWLGVALIVDAVDGPLARLAMVETVLPRWSGERLDLVVDYLTYVAIPALTLTKADLLPQPFRLPAAVAVMLSSLFHIADRESKTAEGYFVGFPAIWNIVCLYLFALKPPPFVSLAIVCILIVLTFVPILCVHPFRVARLRSLTLLVTAAWGAAAVIAVANPFPSPVYVQVLLILTAAYFIGLGISRWLRGAGTR
jgi:phosphatidylcholine synthase